MPFARLASAELVEQLAEQLAVLGAIDRVGAGAEDRHAGLAAPRASLSGVWPPNCTITPCGFSRSTIVQHVLERQRLEVQPVEVS
jgi:hypothetical protein